MGDSLVNWGLDVARVQDSFALSVSVSETACLDWCISLASGLILSRPPIPYNLCPL